MVLSGIGVIVLNWVFMASKHTGTYLSNKIVKLARSDWMVRVSIQLVTGLFRK